MTKRCHRVVQATDLHLLADPDARVRGFHTDASARAVLDAALATQPDLLVLSGDLADEGEAAAYERLLGRLAAVSCPVLLLPGNHDCPATLAAAARRHGRTLGEPTRLGCWQVHGLNSAVAGRADGRLGAAQLAALAQALTRGPALVFVHHHPVPVASPWIDAMGLEDGSRLVALLRGRADRTVVAAGHVHHAMSGWQGSLRWLTTPSTCSQVRPLADRFLLDDVGPAFRWFELRSNGAWATGLERLPVAEGVPAAGVLPG